MIPSTTHGYRQPGYALTIDGRDITPRLNGRLISLSLTDARDGHADQLTLTLSDHDHRTPLPTNGKTLSLALGWAPRLIDKGEFIINEVEITGPPSTVHIRARAVDTTRSLPGQRTASWHHTTLGEIVETIAARHSLTAAIAKDLHAVRVAHIDQTSESDLNFLHRLGQHYDAIASIKAGRLLFIPRGQSTTASGKSLPVITLSPHDGDHYRYVRSLTDSYSGVRAHYNDRSGGRLHYVIAGDGSDFQNVRELKATYATEEDATHAAEAEWARIKRGMAEFHFSLAQGRADIGVESPVRLAGFRGEMEKEQWVATEVAHRLDERGFRTEVRCEPALDLLSLDDK